MDTDTGEVVNLTLMHEGNEVRSNNSTGRTNPSVGLSARVKRQGTALRSTASPSPSPPLPLPPHCPAQAALLEEVTRLGTKIFLFADFFRISPFYRGCKVLVCTRRKHEP
jgi:hypothetical protein